MTTESSVLVNLKDLFEMETERRERQAVLAERDRAEAEARRQREESEHEKALLQAREEERARFEVEQIARDAELRQRVSLLRAELESVREQRAQVQAQMLDAARAVPPASRSGWIAGSLASASLAAALLATFLAWPRPPAPVPIAIPTPTIVAPVAVPEPVVAPVEAPVVATAEPAIETPVPTRPHRHVVPRTDTTQNDPFHSLIDNGSEDPFDPISGIDETPRRPRH